MYKVYNIKQDTMQLYTLYIIHGSVQACVAACFTAPRAGRRKELSFSDDRVVGRILNTTWIWLLSNLMLSKVQNMYETSKIGKFTSVVAVPRRKADEAVFAAAGTGGHCYCSAVMGTLLLTAQPLHFSALLLLCCIELALLLCHCTAVLCCSEHCSPTITAEQPSRVDE